MSKSSPQTDVAAGKAPAWKDLSTRSAVAAVLIPLVILDTWAGGIWFELLVIAIGALVAREWVAMVHANERLQLWVYLAGMTATVVAADHGAPWIAGAAILVAWAASVALHKRSGRQLDTWSYAGVPYVCIPMVAMILLRSESHYGFIAILWVFAVVWMADTLAYFAGKTIGGPKLAPRISPNKTWAGLGGAVAGGMLASLLVAIGAGITNWLVLVLVGGAFAVVEQVGDLFESAAKRNFGVKDSGAIIPGHGGVLDRVDGLMFATAFAWLLGALRGGWDMPASGLLLW